MKQAFQPETPAHCPQCKTALINLTFDEGEGFWHCKICNYVWALDEDDPDYEEEELDDLPY